MEHDELVLRLADVLPGGPYVREPDSVFDKQEFSSELLKGISVGDAQPKD